MKESWIAGHRAVTARWLDRRAAECTGARRDALALVAKRVADGHMCPVQAYRVFRGAL